MQRLIAVKRGQYYIFFLKVALTHPPAIFSKLELFTSYLHHKCLLKHLACSPTCLEGLTTYVAAPMSPV